MSFFPRGRGRGKDQAKEIPAWKQALLDADRPTAVSSAASSTKRPLDDDDGTGGDDRGGEPSAKRPATTEGEDAPPSSSSEREPAAAAAGPSEGSAPDLPPDDDDDEDFDESNYRLGDDDGEEEVQAAVVPGSGPAAPSAEELLNMREAIYGARKSTKTFLIEDDLNSIEKTAGAERSAARRHVAVQLKAVARQDSRGLPTAFGGR